MSSFLSMENNTDGVHVELMGVVHLTNGGSGEHQILHHVKADTQCCIVTLPKQIIKHPCSSVMQNERCWCCMLLLFRQAGFLYCEIKLCTSGGWMSKGKAETVSEDAIIVANSIMRLLLEQIMHFLHAEVTGKIFFCQLELLNLCQHL